MWLNFQKMIKKDQFVHRFQNKMIGLFLGDTDFSEVVLKKIKRLKKNILLLIFLKIINLKEIKIVIE